MDILACGVHFSHLVDSMAFLDADKHAGMLCLVVTGGKQGPYSPPAKSENGPEETPRTYLLLV